MLETVERSLEAALDDTLNTRGRTPMHVVAGLAAVAAVMLVTATVAYREAPTDANPKAKRELDSLEKSPLQPSKKTFAAVWPPMFLLLTLSAVRVWNAPDSVHRTRALGIWGLIQALHAATMAVGVKQQTAQLAGNLATMAGGFAYAREAKQIDPPSAAIIAPYVSWMAFANLLGAELWRRNIDRPDVH